MQGTPLGTEHTTQQRFTDLFSHFIQICVSQYKTHTQHLEKFKTDFNIGHVNELTTLYSTVVDIDDKARKAKSYGLLPQAFTLIQFELEQNLGAQCKKCNSDDLDKLLKKSDTFLTLRNNKLKSAILKKIQQKLQQYCSRLEMSLTDKEFPTQEIVLAAIELIKKQMPSTVVARIKRQDREISQPLLSELLNNLLQPQIVFEIPNIEKVRLAVRDRFAKNEHINPWTKETLLDPEVYQNRLFIVESLKSEIDAIENIEFDVIENAEYQFVARTFESTFSLLLTLSELEENKVDVDNLWQLLATMPKPIANKKKAMNVWYDFSDFSPECLQTPVKRIVQENEDTEDWDIEDSAPTLTPAFAQLSVGASLRESVLASASQVVVVSSETSGLTSNVSNKS